MAIDEELVKEVLKYADIVKITSSYLNVTKKGKNYVAVCPFHDDTNPSLTINPEKQIFKSIHILLELYFVVDNILSADEFGK